VVVSYWLLARRAKPEDETGDLLLVNCPAFFEGLSTVINQPAVVEGDQADSGGQARLRQRMCPLTPADRQVG